MTAVAEAQSAAGSVRRAARVVESTAVGRCLALAWIASIATMIASLAVLAGWVFGIDSLKSVLPDHPTMKLNLAVALLLGGLSLAMIARRSYERPGSAAAVTGQATAAVVVLIGAATLLEYQTGWSFGIDELLWSDDPAPTAAPGRMAPNAAMGLVLIGSSLLILGRERRRGLQIPQLLAVSTGLLGVLSMLSYAFGGDVLFGLDIYARMAIHAGGLLTLLSVGTLCVRPDRGLMTAVTGSGMGAMTVRRLLPAVFLLPIVISTVEAAGQNSGLYDAGYGEALAIVGSIIVLGFVLWRTARLVDQVDEERRIVEGSLREREALLQKMLDSLPVGVGIADSSGQIVVANPAIERIWGENRYVGIDEFAAYKAWRRGSDRRVAVDDMPIVRSLRSGETITDEEYEIESFDGKRKILRVYSSPLRDGAGRIVGAIVVNQDVTGERRAEEMRNDVVAMLSHDIKTPLSAALGFASLLRESFVTPEERAEFLDRIETGVHSAVHLATNFVDAARLDHETVRPKLQSESLNDIVELSLPNYESRSRSRSILLETDLAPDIPPLPLDRALMERVVANLLSNAFKFSPDKSRIVVRSYRSDGRVFLTVQDQGPGVSPEQRPQLFQRFQKMSPTRKEGTGLGLFIVKTAVEAQGGRVLASFPPAGGSVFGVSFPDPLPTRDPPFSSLSRG